MSPILVAVSCLCIFICIIIWDIILYADKTARNSISQVVIDLSKKNQTLPWFVGFLMGWCVGHWWG